MKTAMKTTWDTQTAAKVNNKFTAEGLEAVKVQMIAQGLGGHSGCTTTDNCDGHGYVMTKCV